MRLLRNGLVGSWNRLLKSQLHIAIVEGVSVLGQDEQHGAFAVSGLRVLRIKGLALYLRQSGAVLGEYPNPQRARQHLLQSRLLLEEGDRDLPGSDLCWHPQKLHFHSPRIVRARFMYPDYWHHHFLQAHSAVYVSLPRSRQRKSPQ